MTMTEVEPFDTDRLDRPETRFPIEIRTTSVYTVWVEADTCEQALSRYEDSDRAADAIRDEQPQDGWIETSTSGYGPVTSHGNDFGPCEQCPECGAVSDGFYSPSLAFADHAGSCSMHSHWTTLAVIYDRASVRGPVGFAPACSCGTPNFGPRNLSGAELADVPAGVPVFATREEVGPILVAHVAGQPHSKNCPMGITDDIRPEVHRHRPAAAGEHRG